jgi:hypothetical protein
LKQQYYKKSNKCRLAIERFNYKNKQMSQIEGLTGIRIAWSFKFKKKIFNSKFYKQSYNYLLSKYLNIQW